MKTRILLIFLAGLLLAILSGWSVAAPVPPAGRPKEIDSFQAHPFVVQGLVFSPDGKTLASGGRDGKLKLWEVASGKNLLDIQTRTPVGRRGRLAKVEGVAFSPDGKTLASCADHDIKLWDVATGKNTVTLEGVSSPLLVFSPDGKKLVCGYRWFDLVTKKDRPLVEKATGAWPVAAFGSKGELLAGMSFTYPNPTSFVVWDVKSGKKVLMCKSDRKVFHCDAFSPDGKTVISTEGDYETQQWAIRLWDIASGNITATFEQAELPCKPTFSPNGKVLAVSCQPAADRNDYPGSIRLYEVSSGKVLANLKGYNRVVNCLAFSPDGRLLATGTLDGIIKIWSLPARYKAE